MRVSNPKGWIWWSFFSTQINKDKTRQRVSDKDKTKCQWQRHDKVSVTKPGQSVSDKAKTKCQWQSRDKVPITKPRQSASDKDKTKCQWQRQRQDEVSVTKSRQSVSDKAKTKYQWQSQDKVSVTKTRQHVSDKDKTVREVGQKNRTELPICAFNTIWRKPNLAEICRASSNFGNKFDFSNRHDIGPGNGTEKSPRAADRRILHNLTRRSRLRLIFFESCWV